MENEGSEWVAGDGGRVPPPVFYKRVRKVLVLSELAKYSFLKSAQEIEKKEFDFWRLCKRAKRVTRRIA